MTKKKKAHNAGYKSNTKKKTNNTNGTGGSSDVNHSEEPLSMKDLMNDIYSQVPATVLGSGGSKTEFSDSRDAISSFMNNLPSDQRSSMKELMANSLNCDLNEVDEIYGTSGTSSNKNKKKNGGQQNNTTPSSISQKSKEPNKKNPINIFKMEPLGESPKEIRFKTQSEFEEHSRGFTEFHNKCNVALKKEFGAMDRTGVVALYTFDSELLEIAKEEVALAVPLREKLKGKKDDYVIPFEPFIEKTLLPDWHAFKINTRTNVISGQLAATICKLFRLPIGSIRILFVKQYNWKNELKEPTEFEPRGDWKCAFFSNTKKGIEEFKEWKKKYEAQSKSSGYFNTKSAEDIIKTNLDWREKSKRVFKLSEVDTSNSLSEAENLNWLKYFHDRMITHKLHNNCCEDEVFDGSVEVIWSSLQFMIRSLYEASIPKDYLFNFAAQNTFLSIHPNYRDHSFLCGFKSYSRFYSLHSYGCVDFKYSFFHTTKYYSHVFYTTLKYRIIDLADKESREDKESGWKSVWDNRLQDDSRLQDEDWITIEKRQVNLTLQDMMSIRDVLIGKGKLNIIPISKFILGIIDGATGAHRGESTIVNNEGWIDYRIRKICNEPTPEDANFKEHDFEKDISEALEELKKKKTTNKKSKDFKSDAMYPTDEESGNVYKMLKRGSGGGFTAPPGCPQM